MGLALDPAGVLRRDRHFQAAILARLSPMEPCR